jgi:hypothetical protein
MGHHKACQGHPRHHTKASLTAAGSARSTVDLLGMLSYYSRGVKPSSTASGSPGSYFAKPASPHLWTAKSCTYVNGPEVRLLTGRDPSNPKWIGAHADGLVAVLLPGLAAGTHWVE